MFDGIAYKELRNSYTNNVSEAFYQSMERIVLEIDPIESEKKMVNSRIRVMVQ